jgi:hypothetical protein
MNLYCVGCSRGWEDSVYGSVCPDCGRSKCINCGGQGAIYTPTFPEVDPFGVLGAPFTGAIEDCSMCGGTGDA